jgi:hypothetical protein
MLNCSTLASTLEVGSLPCGWTSILRPVFSTTTLATAEEAEWVQLPG